MNLTDVARMRLLSQQIPKTSVTTAKGIVDWMGAMQAQDFAMAKWAVGVRLPDSSIQAIEAAIDNGEILRTHVLRPTWHFVSSDDIRWMLELAVPQIKASLRSRHKDLGLSETIVAKSNGIMEKALSRGEHLTREDLLAELREAGIATGENRASHLLLRAELDGVVCSGASKGGKQTYALLEERVPKTKLLTKEESLANLARRYFTSRCPASVQDFVWWSGLSVSDAKHALEAVKSDFISETVGSQMFWFTNSYSIPRIDKETAYLLPAFDEFIIGYKSRRASLPLENHNMTVSNNGIFRPAIVVDGQVAGIWKRTIKKNTVVVETQFFTQPGKTTKRLIEKASIRYGAFLGMNAEMTPCKAHSFARIVLGPTRVTSTMSS